MIDRDMMLVLLGGAIGAVSSLATLLVSYWLEGLRLRRQWAREDQLQLRQKREELQTLLAAAPGGREQRSYSVDD